MSHWSILDIEGVFGRVDFREDEKKMRENEEKKLFGEYLVGRERERKMLVGAKCFLLRLAKKFSPK